MSDENVEVVRKGLDAYNRRDADAFVALCSPDVEYETHLGEIYRGRGEVRRHFEYFEQTALETWESFHVEVEEITEASDDRIVVGTLVTARGKASGVPVELRTWAVVWFADGKVTRRRPFRHRADALEAAGLRE
jgi:ketosteroid isomerase-like protein